MAKYEASSNLIDQLQILLNKEAGVESFTSINHHQSLHSLPSSSSSSFLNDAILFGSSSSSNSSIDVLRCINCRGELLRGLNSIICVYCGHYPNHDSIPQPLSFESTLAFQWFLQSLGLDGLESVGTGASLGGTQVSDRGRSSNKQDEISVSEFVDLQLKWPDELRGVGLNNEEGFSGKRYLRLVGIDVEEILTQDSRDHGSSDTKEVGVAGQKNEYEETRTTGDRSLSLFENVQLTTDVSLRSGEGENDESFSDWGAEFQTAIPEPVRGKSGNVAMFDAASGDNLATPSNKLSSKLDSGPPFFSKVSDGQNMVDGGGKAFDSVDRSFDQRPADQQHTTNEESANSEKRDGDDPFDEWGDFRMSMGNKITQSEPSGTAVPGTDSSDGLIVSDPFNKSTESVVSNNIELKNNSFRVPDDAWNNFAITSAGGDHQSQIISDKPEQHPGTSTALGGEIDLTLFDGINLQHQGINAESTQNKIFDQGDPIGLWSNDMHFDIKGDELQGRENKSPASGGTNGLDNSFDLWNNIKGSDKQQATDNTVPTAAGSTFDAWNDLAGLGVGKKEEICSRVEILGEKESSNQSDSLGLWNDQSLDAWSGFVGLASVSDSKPINNDIGWNDFPSLMVTRENQPQSSNTRIPEDKAVLEDDNLFGSWSDFRSFGVQTETSSLGPNDSKTSADKISFQKATSSQILVEDNSMLSSWGDLGVTASIEQQLQGATVGSSEHKLSSGGDFCSGLSDKGKQSASLPDIEVQCEGGTMLDGTFTCENEDSFDGWTEFTSSSKVQANPSTSYAPDCKEAVIHSNIYDAWNVIDSSLNVQASKETAVAIGKTPKINSLDPSDHSEYVAPNSSMHPDLCVGMLTNQNGSVSLALLPPEVPDLVRKEHGDVKADSYNDRMNPSESTSKEELDLKSSVAETLISEMRDLSFMLESDLSIPGSGR